VVVPLEILLVPRWISRMKNPAAAMLSSCGHLSLVADVLVCGIQPTVKTDGKTSQRKISVYSRLVVYETLCYLQAFALIILIICHINSASVAKQIFCLFCSLLSVLSDVLSRKLQN